MSVKMGLDDGKTWVIISWSSIVHAWPDRFERAMSSGHEVIKQSQQAIISRNMDLDYFEESM